MAAAIPEWIDEQFPSKKMTINTVVSQRLVAAERNSLWIWSSTRKLLEESGSVLGIVSSAAVYKAVGKELIHREMSPCSNTRNWKVCCSTVMSANNCHSKTSYVYGKKKLIKDHWFPVSDWKWAECFPLHSLGLHESFSCFLCPHSLASLLPGLVWYLLHRFAWSAGGLLSARKPIYSLQCSYKPALPTSFCTTFYLPIYTWPYCICVPPLSLLMDSLVGSGHYGLSLTFFRQ